MDVVRVAQVGDIHYPLAVGGARAVDAKDAKFPSGLSNAATANSLQNLTRRLVQLRDDAKAPLHAIVFCGDLTDKGDLGQYQLCVDYFTKSLQLNDPKRWPPAKVHVVPGNHDIEREKVDRTGVDLHSKFGAFQKMWQPVIPSVLPITAPRRTEFKGSSTRARACVTSLNSCLGCQEWRSKIIPADLDPKLARRLRKLFEKLIAASADIERLDTPAFAEVDLSDTADHVRALPPECVPIILAHHNILPQSLPRLDLYTELVNGGMARSRLSTCGRPVIYMHGHIHQDPVDIVIQADNSSVQRGCLVSVSAPRFADGFNVVEVHFGRTEWPIGVVVNQYRMSADGHPFDRPTPTRIPFYQPRFAIEHNLTDAMLHHAVSILPKGGTTYMRFNEFYGAYPAAPGERRPDQKVMSDVLREAEWLGFLMIQNREQDLARWQIRRVSP